MSKARKPRREGTHKLTREQRKSRRAKRREKQKLLIERLVVQGLEPPPNATRANSISPYQTVEEEQQARSEATLEHARIIRSKLWILMRVLSTIPDPRNPLLISHTLETLLLYGVLSFVLQMASRRKANEQLTTPAMVEQLKRIFPELETIPHHDSVNRLLARIDVQQLEQVTVELVRYLIRNKKFRRQQLIGGCYPIAIDGTQKITSKELWGEQWLEREVGNEGEVQYYIHVLEASLVLANGMTLPLMSEFLDYLQGDSERNKQDCERRAFFRLAERLKKAFSHLPILLLLDGLFPTGPLMERCRKYGWQFMIVLQDGSLQQVWEEYQGLKGYLEPEDRHERFWRGRSQRFHWINDIEYCYGPNGRKTQTVHLVVCEESWPEVDESGEIVTKSGRHVWISSEPLSRSTVHRRCNLGARRRWDIEEQIKVEKRHGYHYEHCYSYNWNALRGYHYLMRIAHFINALAQYSIQLAQTVKEKGLQGFIQFVRETLSGRWLDPGEVESRLSQPFQLRFV